MTEASNLRNTPQQNRSEVRLAIIRANARTHLLDVGVRSFSTQVVAEMGGMSIGTVYRYFADTEALIEDVAPGACRAWVVLDEARGILEEVPDSHQRDALERILFIGVPVAGQQTADQYEVDRHAEKQGVSYSDAWRYFEKEGYDMSLVDPQYRDIEAGE